MDAIDVPECLTSPTQQLIMLVGLDVANNPMHRTVADSFCTNRRADRLPLHFRLVSADHEFRRPKPKVYDSD
jgi:hypothetical protein